ncbi:MAG: autotransporter-associated beta strand repeat-containing protein, partial [Pirellulales bacterium]|nr:autotransporter-associated beta strand repeat-containing protein [Pirellulales bacterium]
MKHEPHVRNRPRLGPVWRRLSLAGVLLASVIESHAVADTWDNSSGDALWSTAANWADNSEPASTTEPVTFPNPGGFYNANISLSAGEVCGSLTFDAIYNLGSGTLNVGAAGGPISVRSFVTATINSVLNGNQGLTKNGAGTLTLGGVNTFTGDVAINAGTMSVNADSRLGSGGNNVVINAGTLQATASLSTSRSFTVNSGGSAMTVAGNLALLDDGALNILAGGKVEDAIGIVGSNAGSTGVVTVNGANSKWVNSNQLQVGAKGQGTLRIEAGGSVSTFSGTIALSLGSNGSSVTVTGAGSTLTCSDDLLVGQLGGELRIE